MSRENILREAMESIAPAMGIGGTFLIHYGWGDIVDRAKFQRDLIQKQSILVESVNTLLRELETRGNVRNWDPTVTNLRRSLIEVQKLSETFNDGYF